MSAYFLASPSCPAVVLSCQRFLLPVGVVRFSRRFQSNVVFANLGYSRSEVSLADLFPAGAQNVFDLSFRRPE